MTPDTAHKVSALVAKAAEALGAGQLAAAALHLQDARAELARAAARPSPALRAAAIAERLAIPRSQVEAVLAHAGGREARR